MGEAIEVEVEEEEEEENEEKKLMTLELKKSKRVASRCKRIRPRLSIPKAKE